MSEDDSDQHATDASRRLRRQRNRTRPAVPPPPRHAAVVGRSVRETSTRDARLEGATDSGSTPWPRGAAVESQRNGGRPTADAPVVTDTGSTVGAPVADAPTTGPDADGARGRSKPDTPARFRLRRSRSKDDEGPFFPPDTAPDTGMSPENAAPARPRPAAPARPRPDQSPASAPGRPTPRSGPAGSVAAATKQDQRKQDSPKQDPPKQEPPKPDPARKGPSLRERLRGSRNGRRLTRYVILVVVVLAAALGLRTYVAAPYYIPSASMEPTLHGCPGCNDDHVLVDKFSYRFHHPHTGDIVVFDKPKNLDVPESVLIKRVVAVGGDNVALRGGRVFVNGKVLSEPYLLKSCGRRPSRPLNGRTRWAVPDDDVFVMGDNRCDSTDSRQFGPIATSSIIGRAFVIVWPLKRFSFL